jgi:RNA-directed DNA polymerase
MSGDVHVRFCERLGVRFPRATHLVLMARFIDGRIIGWVEETVEGWLGLKINRKKTRVIMLTPESDASRDFLGYTFRYEWGYTDRTRRFLTVVPSAKAVAVRRSKSRKLTDARRGFVPVSELVEAVNRQLWGWANYFSLGYPRPAYRVLNAFAVNRLTIHLKRRSQRPLSTTGRDDLLPLPNPPFGSEAAIRSRATPR